MSAPRYAFTAGNPGTRGEYDGHCSDSAGRSVPGSPYQLPAGSSGGELPCSLVPGYTPGPLATAQLPPVPISYSEAKANGFVLRQPVVVPPPVSAEQGSSITRGLSKLGKAVTKPVSAALAWSACGLQNGMKAIADVGMMRPSGGKSACYENTEPALNEALKPDFTSPEAVASTVLGIVLPEARIATRLKQLERGLKTGGATPRDCLERGQGAALSLGGVGGAEL